MICSLSSFIIFQSLEGLLRYLHEIVEKHTNQEVSAIVAMYTSTFLFANLWFLALLAKAINNSLLRHKSLFYYPMFTKLIHHSSLQLLNWLDPPMHDRVMACDIVKIAIFESVNTIINIYYETYTVVSILVLACICFKSVMLSW